MASNLKARFGASPFPAALRFEDVEIGRLARDERPLPIGQDAWADYLRRVLPPVVPDPVGLAGAPGVLRTPAGMADFLLTMGPGAARDMCRGLDAQNPAFWGAVAAEVDRLGRMVG